MAELDSNGTIQAVNTFGAQGLVSRRTAAPNASVFYTFDKRGNVAQRLDSNGVILSTDLYDGFGARTGTSLPSTGSSGDLWGFGAQWGYQTDNETGLVLCTNRYYDPQQGRFLTRDPAGYNGGMDLYAYMANNPVNDTDASGLMPTAERGCKESAAVNAGIKYACKRINAASTTSTPNGAGITASEKKCLQGMCNSNMVIKCGSSYCATHPNAGGYTTPGGPIVICTGVVGNWSYFPQGIFSVTGNIANTVIHEMLHQCGRGDNGGPVLPVSAKYPNGKRDMGITNPADDGRGHVWGLGHPT